MNVGKGNSCEEFFIEEIKELQEEHDSAPSSQLHKLFVLQTPLQSHDVHSSIVVVVVAAEEFEDGEDSSSSTTALVLLLEATLVASATLQSTRTGMTPVGQTVQGHLLGSDPSSSGPVTSASQTQLLEDRKSMTAVG